MKDNFTIITPLLLNFCCPFLGIVANSQYLSNQLEFSLFYRLDELQKLMTKFTTGVKRYEQKIKDVSHLFAFELVNDYSAQSNYDNNNKQDKHQIQAGVLFASYSGGTLRGSTLKSTIELKQILLYFQTDAADFSVFVFASELQEACGICCRNNNG